MSKREQKGGAINVETIIIIHIRITVSILLHYHWGKLFVIFKLMIVLNPILISHVTVNLQCWDLGLFLSIKQVYSTGYIVSTLSVVSGLALAAI